MNFFQRFFGHLKTVCVHRWWVFYYCCKAGIPIQGFLHDLSKFSPVEFFEGVKYFNGKHSPIDDCKAANRFSWAWQHHKGRNRHHYEYWVDYLDRGGERIRMPEKYAIEMLCDYVGAGRAYNKKNFSWQKEWDWWESVKTHRQMHSADKCFIENCLLDCLGGNGFISKKNIRATYHATTINFDQNNEAFEKFVGGNK